MSNIYNLDSNFIIKADNVSAALAAVKHFYLEDEEIPNYYSEEDFRDLPSAFSNFGWSVDVNEQGDVLRCRRTWDECEYFNSDFLILDIIAPYVERGSYIELCDECGVWREYFDGNAKERYAATYVYEYEKEQVSNQKGDL